LNRSDAVSLVALLSAVGFFLTLVVYAVVSVIGSYRAKLTERENARRRDLERRISKSRHRAQRRPPPGQPDEQ